MPNTPARLAAPLLILTTLFPACTRRNDSAPPRLAARAFIPATDAATDPSTRLPTRIVHQPSGITLVLIPPGEFLMGSPPDEPDRSRGERRHRRVIRRPFYLGETEVTVAQFRRFVGATGYRTDAERGTPSDADTGHPGPGSFATVPPGDRDWHAAANWRNVFPNLPEDDDTRPRDDYPVVHVSWNDAHAFSTHYGLRLPTEAEWEYAARVGGRVAGRFPWCDDESAGGEFDNVADESRKKRFPNTNVMFPFDDRFAVLSPVKHYRPNALGLYDTLGNVEEWVQDTYGPYPSDGADESAAQPKDPTDPKTTRVLRGGSWVSNQTSARLAARIAMRQTSRRDFQGFRVAAGVESVRDPIGR